MHLFARSLARLAAVAAMLAAVAAKSGPTSVAYVEVNTDAIGNVGRYTLSDGSNAFDIGIIFAANINLSNGAAVLYNNDNVQAVLNDAANQIVPLQQKGIKVLLSILGNHEAAGISNFQSQQAATDFANQVSAAVSQYNLDGVDLDDEYADYSSTGTNNQSIGWLISALRTAMPDKIISFYNYGPASTALSSSDASIGSQLSYSWNAIYDTYSAPSIPGLGNSQLSAAAVDFGSTSASDADSFAQQTVSDGYGAYMTYALANGDSSSYVSGITQALYGLSATYQ